MTTEYIESLRDAIRHTHGCDSSHTESVPVRETFEGKTVWEGMVEVFTLTGHPVAEQCYAWGFEDDDRWQYVAVLKIHPADSPTNAVRAYIASRRE